MQSSRLLLDSDLELEMKPRGTRGNTGKGEGNIGASISPSFFPVFPRVPRGFISNSRLSFT
jgi:hypothetical protein